MKCIKRDQNIPQSYRHKPRARADTSWICLFLIFWCFLSVIIAFSITYGNYSVAINSADSFGNVCGQKHNKHFENFTLSATDTSKKPFLLFFDIEDLEGVVKICVEKCPGTSLGSVWEMFEYFEKFSTQVCRYDVNLFRASISEDFAPAINRRGPCPPATLESKPYRNICVPTSAQLNVDEVYTYLNSGGLDQFFFMAVYLTGYYVAVLCGFAFVISLILLALMFWLPKLIAWLIWFLAIIINGALCIVLWWRYKKCQIGEYKKELWVTMFKKTKPGIDFEILDEFRANNILLFCSAILTTFTAIILIILTLILFKHLNRIKVLFEEARVCIKGLPGLSIAPIIALFNLMLLILLSGYTLLCITTATYPTKIPTTIEEDDPLIYIKDKIPEFRVYQQIKYSDSKPIRRSFWIYIVGFLWTTEFIFAFEEFCIGAAIAFWYFASSNNRSPSPHAIKVLFKYHLGTIAKGSAAITLFKIPRLIFTFICKSIKNVTSQVSLGRLQSIEEYFGIFSHNAYAPAAFETTHFCPAAAVAWKIFNKNAVQVESINNVFDLVMFFSKLCVTSLTCLLGIILLKDKKDNLLFYMAPVLFSTFCAFCIAHIVFSIFEMTVDTLLLCACEDQLLYGGLKRLTNCNLAKLFRNNGEHPVQVIRIRTTYTQPFGSKN